MSQSPNFPLVLPPTINEPSAPRTIQTEGVVVVIGANGCGKTRFGNWIETIKPALVHRIAAQKSLMFPDSVSPSDIEFAHNSLLYGYQPTEYAMIHKHSRWNNNPTTGFLNDYPSLLNFLFAEESQRNADYTEAMKNSTSYSKPPKSRLDVIKRIWGDLLPERRLEIKKGKVIVSRCCSPDVSYQPSEMSDGERVAFYLIGQALSARENSVIIIDEPELHLHKGVQNRLWDSIELERPDCLFVYLTHDLDFAASRLRAKKIWLREFDGTSWDWEILDEDDRLPEPLRLRILGSRKKTLFVEGTSGGLDEEVYTHIYPDWSIIPCGSCEHVIHATAIYSSMPSLHHLKGCGIIDRDERTPVEISNLLEAGVHVLEFSEIENIFLIGEVLEITADRLLLDKSKTVASAQEKIIKLLDTDRERIASTRVVRRIQESARYFQTKVSGSAALSEQWTAFHQSIQPSACFDVESQRIQELVAKNDYDAAIRIYPNKGLAAHISGLFGVTNLQHYIRRILAGPDGELLRSALRKYLPIFG